MVEFQKVHKIIKNLKGLVKMFENANALRKFAFCERLEPNKNFIYRYSNGGFVVKARNEREIFKF